MHSYPSSDGRFHLVRLDRGEEVIRSLADFVTRQELGAGSIVGIGAVENTELGYFDLHSRQYDRRTFEQEMELVSLTGNIAWADGEPVIHAHAVLGGADYGTVGGHLFSATIAVTGEFYINVLPEQRIERALDERTGLKLIR